MLIIKDLEKTYGKFKALNSLNLEINEGEIFGFIGPNGAGKSTTMKIVSGLLLPDSGEVYVANGSGSGIFKKLPLSDVDYTAASVTNLTNSITGFEPVAIYLKNTGGLDFSDIAIPCDVSTIIV